MKNNSSNKPESISQTHGFRVNTAPYDSKWDHISVKETTQRLISINKAHRKKVVKNKLCFTTSTRCIPMRAKHTNVDRPSSAPPSVKKRDEGPKQPTPPSKPNPYSTTTAVIRKIKSATPRFNVEDKPLPPEPEPPSPKFELRRSPTRVEMNIADQELENKLKIALQEKCPPPVYSILEDEVGKLRKKVQELETTLDLERKMGKERENQLQCDFNKNLKATLDEKRADIKKAKEAHYAELNALKKKMNDCLKVHRAEASMTIAKLKGEIDMGRENLKHYKEKSKQEHSEELQDLQSELTIKHHREKNKCLWELEERLVKDKDRALHELKTKLEGDINLLKLQHSQEMDEVLHTFDGVNIEEIDQSRLTIKEQEMQLMTYRSTQKKLETELSEMRTDLNSHKSALKELQNSFFDKVHEVDKKYNQQLSSLLIDNKDLRRRYLKKCDELFTLKAAFNRLQEAKAYIAKETLSALMQGKQPHVITSSAVKASWSSDNGNAGVVEGGNKLQRSASERASSAGSGMLEDPACLMLSTCSYIMDNSGSRNPQPMSDNILAKDGMLEQSQLRRDEMDCIECSDSEENLLSMLETQSISDRSEYLRPMSSSCIPTPPSGSPSMRRVGRPVSSVCVVRPHSRQSINEDKPRAISADSRLRNMGAAKPKNEPITAQYTGHMTSNSQSVAPKPKNDFLDVPNLPALPASPELSRRQIDSPDLQEEELT